MLLSTRRCATPARVAAIDQLKALIVGAPQDLRAELRGRSTTGQIDSAPACGHGQPGRWSTGPPWGRCGPPPSASRPLVAEADELEAELAAGPERAASAAAAALDDALSQALPLLQPAAFERPTRRAIGEQDWDLDDLRTACADAASVELPKLARLRRVSIQSIGLVLLIALVACAIISALADVGLANLIDELIAADLGWLAIALALSARDPDGARLRHPRRLVPAPPIRARPHARDGGVERAARRVGALQLFLTPLDHHREWYRYHHLFGQLLRVELGHREPKLLPALHRRPRHGQLGLLPGSTRTHQ